MFDVTKIQFDIDNLITDPKLIMVGRYTCGVSTVIEPESGLTFEDYKIKIADELWRSMYGDLMPCLHRLRFIIDYENNEEAKQKIARLFELLERPAVPKGWPSKLK